MTLDDKVNFVVCLCFTFAVGALCGWGLTKDSVKDKYPELQHTKYMGCHYIQAQMKGTTNIVSMKCYTFLVTNEPAYYVK